MISFSCCHTYVNTIIAIINDVYKNLIKWPEMSKISKISQVSAHDQRVLANSPLGHALQNDTASLCYSNSYDIIGDSAFILKLCMMGIKQAASILHIIIIESSFENESIESEITDEPENYDNEGKDM
ncbi:hypothetical protein Anas_12698 [Armadillidium nasatum]|uniref:Uncharacterized protein n=1 Tax=Armadillidium nasatum TaxID=96803 RepID=A0A5N5TPM7_9CRUS|nr:hypothetical protein Anas_12698 [Armadillidium nasatum]